MTWHHRGFTSFVHPDGGRRHRRFQRLGAPAIQAQGANDRIVLAVMGVNGRGSQLARMFAGAPNAEVGYIVDVDDKAIAKGVTAVAKGGQTKAPKTSKDIPQGRSRTRT